MVERPEKLYLSAPDADDEHIIWFDPDDGGTEYIRADLYAALEAKLAERVKIDDDLISKLRCTADIAPSSQDGFTHLNDACRELMRRTLSALESTPPAPKVTDAHPDDLAVDRFAIAMKAKLTKKRAEGRRGWDDPAECSAGYLSMLLVDHIEKGDPLDVGNLAMMLHERGDRIADERERYAAKRAALTAAQEAGKS